MTYVFAGAVLILALAYYGTVRGFLDFLSKERADAFKREQTLLDRIQRPETVPPAAMPEGPPERGTVRYDDDEDLKAEMKRLEEPEWFKEQMSGNGS